MEVEKEKNEEAANENQNSSREESPKDFQLVPASSSPSLSRPQRERETPARFRTTSRASAMQPCLRVSSSMSSRRGATALNHSVAVGSSSSPNPMPLRRRHLRRPSLAASASSASAQQAPPVALPIDYSQVRGIVFRAGAREEKRRHEKSNQKTRMFDAARVSPIFKLLFLPVFARGPFSRSSLSCSRSTPTTGKPRGRA